MTDQKKHQAVFLALMAALSAAGWHPLFETFSLSARNDEYTHLLLILPVSVLLIFFKRECVKDLATWELRRGFLLLAAAVAICCFAQWLRHSYSEDVILAARMFALVLSWIGAFVMCFGKKAFRSVLFPLLFLFGLVPVPTFALDFIIASLQQYSAWSAHLLFAAFGVPVSQQGVVLTIPGLIIEVAEECSSIRSSSMLLVTTLVLAHLLLRSPWRKVLVVALTLPLSVAKNGFRIFTIVMLGTKVDPGYLTGRLHHQGGILFFLAALTAVFGILWLLRRGEAPSSVQHFKSLQKLAASD